MNYVRIIPHLTDYRSLKPSGVVIQTRAYPADETIPFQAEHHIAHNAGLSMMNPYIRRRSCDSRASFPATSNRNS